jgi:hypothetical protein
VDFEHPVPSTDTAAPPPHASAPWNRPSLPHGGPQPVPRLPRMEPCPHCGNHVHLATHKCYVTQRDLSCWTCGQKGHVRMTCKAGRPGSATVTMSPHAEPEDLNRTLVTLRRQLDGLSGRDEARFLALKEDLHEILAAQARQRASRASLQARARPPPTRPSSAPPPTSRDPHPRATGRHPADPDTSPESSPVATRPLHPGEATPTTSDTGRTPVRGTRRPLVVEDLSSPDNQGRPQKRPRARALTASALGRFQRRASAPPLSTERPLSAASPSFLPRPRIAVNLKTPSGPVVACSVDRHTAQVCQAIVHEDTDLSPTLPQVAEYLASDPTIRTLVSRLDTSVPRIAVAHGYETWAKQGFRFPGTPPSA